MAKIKKPKFKYKVGDVVYFVVANSSIESIVIGSAEFDEPTKQVYYRTSPESEYYYLERYLFYTRVQAMRAQIKFWQNMLKNELLVFRIAIA